MTINVRYGLFFIVLFFVSCSTTLEERARKQMRITLANECKYANEFEITNENVIYNSDSVFIMLFHMKGKKDNGDITEGDFEYAYEEKSMWAYDHPDVRVWDDYFREIGRFGKNSVELHLDNIKEMSKKELANPIKSPYSIIYSALFSVSRKVPSEFKQKTDEYKKEQNKKQKL